MLGKTKRVLGVGILLLAFASVTAIPVAQASDGHGHRGGSRGYSNHDRGGGSSYRASSSSYHPSRSTSSDRTWSKSHGVARSAPASAAKAPPAPASIEPTTEPSATPSGAPTLLPFRGQGAVLGASKEKFGGYAGSNLSTGATVGFYALALVLGLLGVRMVLSNKSALSANRHRAHW
jgi:hypothetical protein